MTSSIFTLSSQSFGSITNDCEGLLAQTPDLRTVLTRQSTRLTIRQCIEHSTTEEILLQTRMITILREFLKSAKSPKETVLMTHLTNHNAHYYVLVFHQRESPNACIFMFACQQKLSAKTLIKKKPTELAVYTGFRRKVAYHRYVDNTIQ